MNGDSEGIIPEFPFVLYFLFFPFLTTAWDFTFPQSPFLLWALGGEFELLSSVQMGRGQEKNDDVFRREK